MLVHKARKQETMSELLIVNIDGGDYGIRKDDVVSVREKPTLHRLPGSPASIAGLSIIDGKTVLLADLAACLGCPSASDRTDIRALIAAFPSKTAGFIVSGPVESLPVEADGILPVPHSLS